jgi:hypothetical protein
MNEQDDFAVAKQKSYDAAWARNAERQASRRTMNRKRRRRAAALARKVGGKA